MKQHKSEKARIIEAAKKMVEDKKALIAYSNGELSKGELHERKIILALPL